MSRRGFALLVTVALLIVPSLGLLPAGAYHDDPSDEHAWADDAFQRTWARTDKPVVDVSASRTWIWGPTPFTGGSMEPYAEAPGGMRLTQYTDKSRMEDNSWRAADAPWDVTNGLLVVEMMDGMIQVGDDAFEPHPGGPATENVAGDEGADNGPTYAVMAATRDSEPNGDGLIIATIDAAGQTSLDGAYLAEGVQGIDVNAPTGHTVASVFWELMTSSGLLWVDGAIQAGPLFESPVYATGYPVTPAFWSRVLVGGVERDVLLQCFERRCLTYTPANPEGWQVEAGNVGQHYYRWRYDDGDEPVEPSPARLFVAELSSDTKSGLSGDPWGRASFFLDDTGQILHFNLSWAGLDAVTAAHIHMGAAGEGGDVIFTLIVGNPSAAARPMNAEDIQTALGQINTDLLPPGVTLEQLLSMMSAGQIYVDIHTQAHPGGALRGQVSVAETITFVADLTNEQVVADPPSSQPNTGATGTAWLQYNRAAAALTCQLEVSGIVDVVAAHIHIAPPRANGPPVAVLYPAGNPPADSLDGNLECNTITSDDIDIPVVLAWNIGGDSLEALVFQMMTGNAYVNVSTGWFPSGEIRGQIRVGAPRIYWPSNHSPSTVHRDDCQGGTSAR